MTNVLVFESDAAFAGELRDALSKLGCVVRVVDDGTVGLQAAAEQKPDLILLTIELPRVNGFSICNKLKKDAALKDVPLVIMSSESSDETFEQHKKLRTRAEEYLRKPISTADLLARVQTLVPLGGTDDFLVAEIEEAPTAAAPPPPAPPPPAQPARAPARPAAPSGKPDAEIDDFIGGAFNRLLGEEVEDEPTAVVKDAGPSAPVPPPKQSAPPIRSSAPPRVGGTPHAPPVSGAPGPDPEIERLRAELSRSKDEVVRLEKDAAAAHATIHRLETQHPSGGDDAELTRLKREVEELRARATSTSGAKGATVSSREFLDLREALNKKDKELLNLRDQLGRKDKEALDLRDQALALERQKADQEDKLLELERAKGELEAQVEALTGDLGTERGRREGLERKGHQLEQDLSAARGETDAARKAAELADASAKETLERTRAEHDRSMQQATDDASRAKESALAELERRLSAEKTEALSRAKQEADAALVAALAAQKSESDGVLAEVKAHADALLARTQSEAEQARVAALAAQRAEADELLATSRRDASELLARTKAEAAELLETARSEAAATLSKQKAEADALLGSTTAAASALLDKTRSDAQGLLERTTREAAELLERTRAEDAEALAAAKSEAAEALAAAKSEAAEALAAAKNEGAAAVAAAKHEGAERLAAADARATAQREELEGRHAGERSALEDQRAALDKDLGATRERLETAEERILELSSSLERTRQDLARTSGALDDEKKGRVADVERLSADLSAANQELDARASRCASLEQDLGSTRASLDERTTRVAELERSLATEKALLDKARRKWGEDRASLEKAKEALSSALGQIGEAFERPLE